MKKHYLLFILAFVIVSCSSDDNNDNNTNTPGAFLPATEGNYWVYDVESSDFNGRDSLYVANDTVIGNNSYKKLKTKEQPFGFFSTALRNNGIRNNDGKILVSGIVDLSLSPDFPLTVPVSDFVIFDEDADNSEILSTMNGTIEQELDGIVIEFEYSLTSKAKSELNSYTAGTQTYNDVIPVEMTLGLKITAKLEFQGIPIEYPVMTQQDVVTSVQYYANGIGMVHAVTDITYNLEETPGFELPVPQSATQHVEEILADYSVE